ncbi:hypothetical protein [Sinorhizobium meliloti]|nr:hypothetical protein [Sinorhizobium meliloti]
MTELQLILVIPLAVLGGQALGFAAVFVAIRADDALRARRPQRVAPPAA